MAMKWYDKEVDRAMRNTAVWGSPANRLGRAAIILERHARTRIKEDVSPPTSEPRQFPHQDTGHLARNIGWEVAGICSLGGGAVPPMILPKLVAYWGTNVEYGRYLETGTFNMRARPWMSKTNAEQGGAVRRLLTGKLK